MAGDGRWAPSAGALHLLPTRHTLTPPPHGVDSALVSASAREWEPGDDAFQELPNQASNWSAGLLAWLGIPNILQEDVPDVPPEYYSCQFKASKLSR